MNIFFVCIENSCRSQIAEILANFYNSNNNLKFFSCGTNLNNKVHPFVFQAINEILELKIDESQYYPKTINSLLDNGVNPDYLISMGCNVGCPILSQKYDENWGLDDPKNLNFNEFKQFVIEMKEKIIDLIGRLNHD